MNEPLTTNPTQNQGTSSLTKKLLSTKDKTPNQTRIPPTYSKPSTSMIDNLEKRRSKSFFKRIFTKLGPGSLRGASINFIRMSTGVGIMALPFYVSKFGMFLGVLFIILGGFLTYLAILFNFQAQKMCKKKQIDEIVKFFLPNVMAKIFKVTISLDLVMPPMIYIVMGWNIFNYVLYIFGFVKQEWIVDPFVLEFNDYNPMLFLIRVGLLHMVFFLMIPLFLKKTLESLKFLSIIFLGVFLFLVIIVFIQAPFFFKKYRDPTNPSEITSFEWFKDINNLSSLKYGFSILLAFYCQPYVFSIRNQVLLPTMRRLKKVTNVNLISNYVLYISFAVVGYAVWGDKYTPSLMILRKPIDSAPVLEIFFKIALILFFILTFMGIASFNPTLREALVKIWFLKGILH
jgi:amino acid permease